MRSFTFVALAALPLAFGQFGPASTASASLGPAPTESIGCRVGESSRRAVIIRVSVHHLTTVDGAWDCAAARGSSSSTSAAAAADATSTATRTVAASTTAENGLYPPAESTGCVAHGDHFHCEGPASGYTATGTPTSASPSVPSPTESSNCMWREFVRWGMVGGKRSVLTPDISHWDCFDTAAQLEEAQTSSESSESGESGESGECIIHVGHT